MMDEDRDEDRGAGLGYHLPVVHYALMIKGAQFMNVSIDDMNKTELRAVIAMLVTWQEEALGRYNKDIESLFGWIRLHPERSPDD